MHNSQLVILMAEVFWNKAGKFAGFLAIFIFP